MQFFNDEENSYDNDSIDNNPNEIERLKLKFNFSFLNPQKASKNANCLLQSKEPSQTDMIISYKKLNPMKISRNSKPKQFHLFQSPSTNKSSVNEQIMVNSTKYSVSAIISLMHNNYENMVEYDSLNEDKSPLNNKNYMIPNQLYSTPYKFIASKSKSQSNSTSATSLFHIKKIKESSVNSLSESNVFHFLYFIYEKYQNIINSQSCLSNKILLSLNSIFSYMVSTFKFQYEPHLELLDYSFENSQFKKGRYIFPLFDIVVKCRISNLKVNQCYTFSYSFVYIQKHQKKKEYIHTIKFDYFPSERRIWLNSEIEEYKGNIRRICYLQPILPFEDKDILIFKINLFSVEGRIDPYSIKWFPLTHQEIEPKITSKINLNKQNTNIISSLRVCEVEKYIHLWKTCDVLSNKEIINTIMEIYIRSFKVLEVMYDIVKMFMCRFRMKAYKEGTITRNKYINYDIEVVDKERYIENEAQWLGTLNMCQVKNKVMVKIGDIIELYITDFMK